jgi:hypothetical protein
MNWNINLSETWSKILTNALFWPCVALTFPVVTAIAHAFNPEVNLNYSVFFEIIKYFDPKLFFGLLGGCLILWLMTKFIESFLNKIRKTKSDMAKYVADEIISQIINIGSIINTANIVIFLMKNSTKIPADGVSITENGWLGLAAWGIAGLLAWLSTSD